MFSQALRACNRDFMICKTRESRTWTFILRPGTSQWKSRTTLSIDVEDSEAAGFAMLRKRELKMATENIEKKK